MTFSPEEGLGPLWLINHRSQFIALMIMGPGPQTFFQLIFRKTIVMVNILILLLPNYCYKCAICLACMAFCSTYLYIRFLSFKLKLNLRVFSSLFIGIHKLGVDNLKLELYLI